MSCIQNIFLHQSGSVKEAKKVVAALTITAIALAAIALLPTQAGFIGVVADGILFGGAGVLFALDLVLIIMMCKKKPGGVVPAVMDPEAPRQRVPLTFSEEIVLPPEVAQQVFSYLEPDAISRCNQVSRSWNEATAERMRQNFFDTYIFGKEKWANKNFGEVGEIPPLPSNIYEILHAPCPFWEGKKVYETQNLVLFPDSINGAPITNFSFLNSSGLSSQYDLDAFVASPNEGNPPLRIAMGKSLSMQNSAGRPYWGLITKQAVPNSSRKSYNEQQELVGQAAGYTVPNYSEVIVSMAAAYADSETLLSSTFCETYISLSPTPIEWRYFVDLYLNHSISSHQILLRSTSGIDHIGVGAIRRFD